MRYALRSLAERTVSSGVGVYRLRTVVRTVQLKYKRKKDLYFIGYGYGSTVNAFQRAGTVTAQRHTRRTSDKPLPVSRVPVR